MRSVPQIDIALIQHESEMLNVPARDLSGFLSAGESIHNWKWSLFTENSFDEALARADRFDCLILGYNAIHRSAALREALEAAFPDTGVLVLHQMQSAAYDCLRGELALRAVPLGGRRLDVSLPSGVDGALDVVLNWPDPAGVCTAPGKSWHLTPPVDPWEAVHGLDAPRDGAWRVVLQADTGERRVPVLLRTSAWRRPLLAACTLLLEPGREQHAALLGNLISFCARGLPEVVAFPEAEPEAAAWNVLVHKLALAGTHTVQIGQREPAYDGWPEIGAGTVVAGEGRVGADADAWQERGGRLVTMEAGRLLAREGASDLRWLARSWAAELAGRPMADWLGGWAEGEERRGSILATRAVLRTVHFLRDPAYEQISAGEPGGLGIPDLAEPGLARRVRALLDGRGIERGHIDQTVSTTAAALDLDELLPGLFGDGLRRRVEAWLRQRFEHAPVEDRLDIARRLRDDDLLRRALEGVPAGPSPVVLTKAWDAVVTCGVPVPAGLSAEVAGADELRKSVLVAGSFLTALARCRGKGLDLAIDVDHETVKDALGTLRRDGSLLSGRRRPRHDVEGSSTEALTLLTLFAHPQWLMEPAAGARSPDAQVVRAREPLAPILTEGLLSETARLRIRNAELEQGDRQLRTARNYCAVAAVLGTALAVIAVHAAPRSIGDWITLSTAAILILLAAFAVLGRWGLLPAWARALTALISEGVSGIPERLREAIERR